MSAHLTYVEAVITGLVQGVTELFPVSSLGHNVLIPALLGGTWAKTLNVSDPKSPYLAFVVGLHVATAIAMIAFFWRDWLRIIRGFFSSLRTRSAKTPDERLAWMIILATIPVGLVGAVLQKEILKVFAKPELAAAFLAVNGIILLVSERMRRSPGTADSASGPVTAGAGPAPVATGTSYPGGPPPGYPQQYPQHGYNQQPRQQQWQGPVDPRYGQDDDWPANGQQPGRGQYGQGQPQPDPWGQAPGGDPRYGQQQYGRDQYGQDQRGQAPWGRPEPAPRDPRAPGQQQAPASGGRHSHAAGNAPGASRPGPGPSPEAADERDQAVAADRRLSSMDYPRALFIGAAQVLALLPGISRDGIVTVAGVGRGLRREDAVRFSFLLSAPVILAAGALKAHDLTGPLSKGIHGPIVVGSILCGIVAYVSIRFLTKYFSEDRSLNPFGIYCLIAGLGSLAYLVLK